MKNFLKQHGLWVLFAVAVIAVALAVMSLFSTTSSPLMNLAGIVTSPFRAAYTAVANWFNEKQDYFADVQALREENQALKNQIASMEEDLRQAKSDSEENQRFRKLMNLREKKRDLGDLEPAHILEHSSTNWTSSLTLNQGTEHDVEINDCVITEEGYLVGVVSAVGLNWCTVLTLIDTDTSLGAQVFRTEDIGLAEGDFSLMGQGLLKLSHLPAGTELLGGDLVVTSGLGGYYPSGLVIGSVKEVRLDDSGATQYAVLEPSARFDELVEVFVVKSFEIVS
ncbi:rod shape-determining protein MreC [Dysosmobacter sp. HCP28S3_G4]|uniref:rod shape-determining protein MreC n=1 Tax=Dysosmobacter sp. HCP28S3_G4 TaxID=3438938 RepID=UPI003F053203|nr:rod shape-determining protein MreC [Dysosmobacter sp.]